MKPKVIITAYAHPCLQEELIQRGFDVDVREKIGYDELLDQIHFYHGLVVTTRIKVDQQLLDAATQLKWIGRLGSGMEIIDVDYAVQKNILCASTSCNYNYYYNSIFIKKAQDFLELFTFIIFLN